MNIINNKQKSTAVFRSNNLYSVITRFLITIYTVVCEKMMSLLSSATLANCTAPAAAYINKASQALRGSNSFTLSNTGIILVIAVLSTSGLGLYYMASSKNVYEKAFNIGQANALVIILLLLWVGLSVRKAQKVLENARNYLQALHAEKEKIVKRIGEIEAKLNSMGAPGRSRGGEHNEFSITDITVATDESNNTSLLVNKEKEDADDPSMIFTENRTYPLEFMRLNTFAGMSAVTFEQVLANLGSKEQERFQSFSKLFDERLKEIDTIEPHQVPDNFTRLKFLQADGYNVGVALKRLLECVNWRISIGLDAFLEKPNMGMIERYRHIRVRRIVGIDKTGSPLIFERLGEFLASDEAFRAGMTLDEWAICSVWDLCELMAACRVASDAQGKYQHRINYIGDLTGTRLSGALRIMNSIKVLTRIADRYFPEFGKCVAY